MIQDTLETNSDRYLKNMKRLRMAIGIVSVVLVLSHFVIFTVFCFEQRNPVEGTDAGDNE